MSFAYLLSRFTIYLLCISTLTLDLWLISEYSQTPGLTTLQTGVSIADVELHPLGTANLEAELQLQQKANRDAAVLRVRNFLFAYGSNMEPYAEILVDQSIACGGDYRILIGIAGSESGLGRSNYKLYNPFGYLDGVQYGSYEEALTILSCKISTQHISKCGTDIYCLAKRYSGPDTDINLFVSKVTWFANQV